MSREKMLHARERRKAIQTPTPMRLPVIEEFAAAMSDVLRNMKLRLPEFPEGRMLLRHEPVYGHVDDEDQPFCAICGRAYSDTDAHE